MDGLARSLTAFNAGLKELFKAQHTRSNRLNSTSSVSSAPRCVFCVVCVPSTRTHIRLFSRTWFRVVDATPRCSSLISRHSDAQSGNAAAEEERLSSAGDFFFFSSPSTASAKKKLARCLRVFSDSLSENNKGFGFWNVLPWPSSANRRKTGSLFLLLLLLPANFCQNKESPTQMAAVSLFSHVSPLKKKKRAQHHKHVMR